jgi:hypothetical protein
MQKTFSLLPFLLLNQLGFSQTNFLEGTITFDDGFTLEGYIDYKEWGVNPREISYKFSLDEKSSTASLKDIKSFTIKSVNETYRKAIIYVNNEPIKLQNMNVFSSIKNAYENFILIKDTVFLLNLVEGDLNLYWLNDGIKEHFFIQKGNDSISELIYRKFLIEKNDIKKKHETFEYFTQIKNLTTDCQNPDSDFKHFKYESKALIAQIYAYNNCKGNTQNIIANKGKNNTNSFFIFGSVLQPFTSLVYDKTSIKSQQGNITGNIGVAYEVGFIRNRNKMGLSFEAAYQTFKSKFTVPSESYNDNYNFNMQSAKLNFLLRYTLFTGKVQPYVKGGIGTSLLLKSKNNHIAIYKLRGTPNNIFMTNEQVEGEGIIAAGVKFNNLYCETRYSRGTDISPELNVVVKTNRIFLTLAYQLR